MCHEWRCGIWVQGAWFNSSGRYVGNFKVEFPDTVIIDNLSFSCESVLRSVSQDITDEKSSSVQVMAWCHQAASHYSNQCWWRSMWPHGISRGQWVDEYVSGYINNGQGMIQWFVMCCMFYYVLLTAFVYWLIDIIQWKFPQWKWQGPVCIHNVWNGYVFSGYTNSCSHNITDALSISPSLAYF